jgi:hypothetical protein
MSLVGMESAKTWPPSAPDKKMLTVVVVVISNRVPAIADSKGTRHPYVSRQIGSRFAAEFLDTVDGKGPAII